MPVYEKYHIWIMNDSLDHVAFLVLYKTAVMAGHIPPAVRLFRFKSEYSVVIAALISGITDGNIPFLNAFDAYNSISQ